MTQRLEAGEPVDQLIANTRAKVAALFAEDPNVIVAYDQFFEDARKEAASDSPDVVFMKKVNARLADDPATLAAFQMPFAQSLTRFFSLPMPRPSDEVANKEWQHEFEMMFEPVKASLSEYPDLQQDFEVWYVEKAKEVAGKDAVA